VNASNSILLSPADNVAVANGRIAHLAFTTRDPDPRRGLTWTEDL